MSVENLFSIRQRAYDGKWVVWATVSDREIGNLHYYVGHTRFDVSVPEFIAFGEPACMNSSREVIVAVYDEQPSVHDVVKLSFFQQKIA